jgi:histidine ammonia-lyase
MTIEVDGSPLSLQAVVRAARGENARLTADVPARLAPARAVVDAAFTDDRVVYGVTTGFGALANTHVGHDAALDMQVNLLRSHAAGVGPWLPAPVVRAMLLLRARTLAQGYSGVRAEVPAFLLDLLSADLLPAVPAQGSVGASGDLAPFAHLALPLIGEGLLSDHGAPPEPAADVLARHGRAPLTLAAKEGLSLLNGTEGMLAFGVLAIDRIRRVAVAADIAVALTIEGLLGSIRPFDARIHALRPHPGQIQVAANVRRLLDDSPIVASHADDFDHAVQDAYSLRCAPQVHGAARDVITSATAVFACELGAVVDNPIVFPDTGEVLSAGNFHGQPLAFQADFLAMAATELASISERRTDRLLDPARSAGLPPFLAPQPGRDSGYMLAQYTAAALVAENRVLSHPASIESIPTSGSQEDHVSMGWGAMRKLHDVLDNSARVLAVEIACAVQGIEHRRPLAPAAGTGAVVAAVRAVVPPLDADRPVGADIEAIAQLIEDGTLGEAAAAALGAPLD